MHISTAVTILYFLCETLLAVYSLLFTEVHVQVFEVLLLFPTKQKDDELLPTSDFYFFFKFQVAFLLSSSFTASSQPLSKLSRAFIIFFVPFFSFKCLIIFAHLFYSPQFPFSWGYRLGTSCQMATLTLEHVIISPKLFPFPFWILSLCCLL